MRFSIKTHACSVCVSEDDSVPLYSEMIVGTPQIQIGSV